jgi:hypothetical protein
MILFECAIEPLGFINHRISLLNLQERDLKEGLGVDGRTISDWVLKFDTRNLAHLAQRPYY